MQIKNEIPVLFSADELRERVLSLAREIALKLPPDLMIVSLLKGSFVFTADLIRELYNIGLHPQVDFMTISSYGTGTTSTKNMTINRDLVEEVKGRNVLIVDDILESGKTLQFARNLIIERGALSCRIAVLLEKPGKREVVMSADFVGFTIPDKFVVGYGLDYANYYRELPYVGVLDIH
ncbi:MAG: hypoxanthine phosphoribosyltransferase [Pseudomonadota bacterium]